MDRREIAELVLQVSQDHAEGYRNQARQYGVKAEACAVAASNTGYHILLAMGFSGAEILAMQADRKAA